MADRAPDGARNTTNVIYSRITDGRRFDPVGEAWTGWTPRTDNREWATYLDALAADADRRAAELGRETAAERPAWAVEALGPVPAEPGPARDKWEQQAGLVASYRELRGHDDASEALGPAPEPGSDCRSGRCLRCRNWKRRRPAVPPRPPQRRPNALAPARPRRQQIGPAHVKPLRGEVLGLDPLLVRQRRRTGHR